MNKYKFNYFNFYINVKLVSCVICIKNICNKSNGLKYEIYEVKLNVVLRY